MDYVNVVFLNYSALFSKTHTQKKAIMDIWALIEKKKDLNKKEAGCGWKTHRWPVKTRDRMMHTHNYMSKRERETKRVCARDKKKHFKVSGKTTDPRGKDQTHQRKLGALSVSHLFSIFVSLRFTQSWCCLVEFFFFFPLAEKTVPPCQRWLGSTQTKQRDVWLECTVSSLETERSEEALMCRVMKEVVKNIFSQVRGGRVSGGWMPMQYTHKLYMSYFKTSQVEISITPLSHFISNVLILDKHII